MPHKTVGYSCTVQAQKVLGGLAVQPGGEADQIGVRVHKAAEVVRQDSALHVATVQDPESHTGVARIP